MSPAWGWVCGSPAAWSRRWAAPSPSPAAPGGDRSSPWRGRSRQTGQGGRTWARIGAMMGMAADQEWVLVVEDDEDVRDPMTAALTDEGYQVAGAPSGQEAL